MPTWSSQQRAKIFMHGEEVRVDTYVVDMEVILN